MATEKRCFYEILGLSRDCSAEEIRSAYKKLALQRHPDKLIQTGVPEEEATAAFQELVNAYEVLSDTRERAWYDSHRSQILFSDAKASGSSSGVSPIPDLFSFFSKSVYSGYGDTGKGFFKVYGDLFAKIYAQEVSFSKKLGLGLDSVKDAPLMGNLDSPYSQVSAFYNYWLGFCTVMDFCWVDEYNVMAGPNRKSRRLMEEENKKLRKNARKEYIETVRGLAEFVKKRDKRVIDMQMKRNLEQEKRREEEKARKKEAERVKLEKARLYEEQEWAKIKEEELENGFEEAEDDKKNDVKELYCVFCCKKFKSDKQWMNHEQSKKHREKVAEFKNSFTGGKDEENVEDDEIENGLQGTDVKEASVGANPFLMEEGVIDEVQERFRDDFGFQEVKSENKSPSNEECAVMDSDVDEQKGVSGSFGADDEISILEAMASGHKARKSAASMPYSKFSSTRDYVGVNNEEMDSTDYDTQKGNRRNRAAKVVGGRKSNGEAIRDEISEISDDMVSKTKGCHVQAEEDDGPDSSGVQDSLSHSLGNDTNDQENQPFGKSHKVPNQSVDKKGTGKKDTNIKSKNSSRRKKQKAASNDSGHSCETCGEDFESRNKLHRHLGATGHSTLKTRGN